MPRIGSWKRQKSNESDFKPYIWKNNRKGIGNHSYWKVWIEEKESQGYKVLKDQVDDSGRHQQNPTTLSENSSRSKTRKSAVEWMQNH